LEFAAEMNVDLKYALLVILGAAAVAGVAVTLTAMYMVVWIVLNYRCCG